MYKTLKIPLFPENLISSYNELIKEKSQPIHKINENSFRDPVQKRKVQWFCQDLDRPLFVFNTTGRFCEIDNNIQLKIKYLGKFVASVVTKRVVARYLDRAKDEIRHVIGLEILSYKLEEDRWMDSLEQVLREVLAFTKKIGHQYIAGDDLVRQYIPIIKQQMQI